MLKRDTNFARLRFGGRGSTGSSSYWLGHDHLLVVEVSNYIERYRRFYLRDIQAVVIQQNSWRLWTNLILGGLALPLLVVVVVATPAFSQWQTGDFFTASIFGGIALLLLAGMSWNSLKGPTCTVHVRTAVQTQKLKNITRWSKAEGLMAVLSPLILAIQATPAATTATAPEAGAGPGLKSDPPTDESAPG